MKEEDYEILQKAEEQGGWAKYKTYFKLSGPGWIQGAITLGGGSLAGSLFLGVIGGAHFIWLQPLAMILGVIMLNAIGYVTLSTEKSPFKMIMEHVSPALAWGWIIATLMANVIWSMPQFNLAQAAIKQNLFKLPDSTFITILTCLILFIGAFAVNFVYDSGSKGIKYIENGLKILIAAIILSFVAVVGVLVSQDAINFGSIFAGFIPDFGALGSVTETLRPAVEATGDASSWWSNHVVNLQRDRIIAAFGSAVGINMTFILPYSFLKKKWGKKQRGLALFDLSIGLVVPFIIATTCILITAASQFHAKTSDVLGKDGKVFPQMKGAYHKIIDSRLKGQLGAEKFSAIKKNESSLALARTLLPRSERALAAMLANRDNFNLANTLAPLTGSFWAQIIFGLGVLGMAFSTIITLMMINGFTLCEILGKSGDTTTFRIGCAIAGIGGMMGPFLWTGASKAALAIPTSVIGASLLPLAYLSFLLLMNSKKVMGEHFMTGKKRIVWNVLMITSTVIASFASIWGLVGKSGSSKPLLSNIATIGLVVLPILLILGLVNFYKKNMKEIDK